MDTIFFTSPAHQARFVATMQQIGKIDAGKLDPEYASAVYILTSRSVTWNEAQSYVSRSGIRFEDLLQEVDFSSGYLVLVRLAANLFNEVNEEGQKVRPVDLMILDEQNFQVALTALQIRRVMLPLSTLTARAS